MENSKFRALVTLALLVAAGVSAFLGRLGLDCLISVAPGWTNAIERFGGSALGVLIGLMVVLPLFRLYGVFDDRPNRSPSDTP